MAKAPSANELQAPLLDLSEREYNVNFVDPEQPLMVPNKPLHWKAHKLQLLLARLDKIAEKNPGQLNSGSYIQVLNELNKCYDVINGATDNPTAENDSEVLESGSVGQIPAGSEDSSQMGDDGPDGLDPGIPADYPFAG